jgi:hypothetical protein
MGGSRTATALGSMYATRALALEALDDFMFPVGTVITPVV